MELGLLWLADHQEILSLFSFFQALVHFDSLILAPVTNRCYRIINQLRWLCCSCSCSCSWILVSYMQRNLNFSCPLNHPSMTLFNIFPTGIPLLLFASGKASLATTRPALKPLISKGRTSLASFLCQCFSCHMSKLSISRAISFLGKFLVTFFQAARFDTSILVTIISLVLYQVAQLPAWRRWICLIICFQGEFLRKSDPFRAWSFLILVEMFWWAQFQSL